MNKPFIITGASASGKSTLVNEAIDDGYIYLPTHMTRKPRLNEINNKDAIFLTNEAFEENFNNGLYIEESLSFAKLQALNIYYGTPVKWLEYLKNNGYFATPVSTTIASIIYEQLQDLTWVHLYCNDDDRFKRLMNRGYTDEEINIRMSSGDSINIPESANLIINTSIETPDQIMKKIRRIK